MSNPIEFALKMIENNPMIANNPRNQEFINTLKSGDSARGEKLANNLLNTYGIEKEAALKQAKAFFHFS